MAQLVIAGSACNEEVTGSIPVSGRPSEEGNVNPLQHSYLGNPLDRGAWWATHSLLGQNELDTTEETEHHAVCMYTFLLEWL